MNRVMAALFAICKAKKESTRLKIVVLLFLVGMVALWAILCGVSHRAPDLDGMEELVWASSFEWGYYKHPPLPSWGLLGLVSIFGKPVWLVFFAGQLFSALGLWFVWLLGCEFTSPKKAAIAMLMVSVIVYFSIRGTIYNHNTAQLWSIAASTWLFYRALRYQKTSSWLWLGVVSGLAMLTKYSALIQFAVFFCFLLRQGHFRQRSTQKGVLAAFIVFLVVISPHIYWLYAHAFEPLFYADESIVSSGGYADSLMGLLYFTQNTLAGLSPMLVAWIALFYWNRRSKKSARLAGSEPSGVVEKPYARELSAWDRSFLLWVGLGPIVLTVVVSAALGTWLAASWATTFFILYGFYTFWWLSGDERVNVRRTAIVVIAIHVLMAVGYATARGPIAYYLGRASRSTFPGAVISAQMNRLWHEHVPNVPLRLVASDTWLGGNIATHISPKTNVFIDADYKKSPWLNPQSALDCGALVAYSETTGGAPRAGLKNLFDRGAWHGVVKVPWSSARSPTIVINWAIISPGPGCKSGH
ncbi:MAG: glycosyltransferase family 39 protein [Candidimonas sp.]|nr:MAG: glycosyltransferase family 39 protein [Candidimonas sp.]